MSTETAQRRTKRRYAHELYPHAGEWEVRPLAVEVPYLYARMAGLSLFGTSWTQVEPRVAAGERTMQYIAAAEVALLADALAQGLTGDEAWRWAAERVTEDLEMAYERAAHYGVPLDRIKPYPCGPEPEHHDHLDEPDPRRGWRTVTRVEGRESDCPDCTEEVTP